MAEVGNSEYNLKIVSQPKVISHSAVERFADQGKLAENSDFQIIGECKQALDKMPRSKRGLVLGSGGNSDEWREKGWLTLDIDESCQPDIVGNANYLEDLNLSDFDYVCAECIRFDRKGKLGVSRGRLLNQVNKVMSEGGKLIIITSHAEGKDTEVPDRRFFANLMGRHGFRTVVELFPLQSDQKGVKRQKVIYYGEKIRGGYI